MKIKINIYTLLFLYLLIANITNAKDVINRLEPLNGSVSNNNEVTFRWTPANYLSDNKYIIQIARDSNFTNIILDTTTIVNYFTRTLNENATYFWRIKVKGNRLATDWSDFTTFTVLNINNINSLLTWYSSKSLTSNIGDRLSIWIDLSNNTNNATQTIVAKQPLVVSGDILLNNNKVVRFDGVDDFMAFNKLTNIRTFFILLKHRTGSQTAFAPILGDPTALDFHGSDGILLFRANGASVSPNIYKGIGYVNNIQTSPSLMLRYTDYNLISILTLGNVTASYITNDRNSAGRVWDGDYAEILLFSDSLPMNQFENIRKSIFTKYVPSIAIADTIIGNSFCTPLSMSVPDIYKDYVWSNGATTAATSITPNNTYTVKVKDIFNNEYTTSFKAYPYARLSGTTIYACKGDTVKLDLKTPPNFSVLWNTGLNTPKINISKTGQYTVKVTDGNGCFVFDTVNVIIDDPQLNPTPNISNNLTLCRNEKLFLSAPAAFDSIHWSTGSVDNFIAVSASGNYSVYGRTATGCIINKSFTVDIAGDAPVANFNMSPACQNYEVSFSDSSKAPVGNTISSWKWDFSNGASSSIQNPTNVFSSLGTVSAALKVTTNVGCSDSIYKTFIVNKNPKAAFYNLLSCERSPTTFVDQTIPNSASVTDWSWNFGGLGVSNGIQNIGFVFPSAGTYNVRLKVTNSNSCTDTITIPTIVNPSPVSNFSFDSVCGKTPLSFKFLGTVQPPSSIPETNWGRWDFGDGYYENAIKNPKHIYNAPGIYDVKLVVNSTNQCADTVTKKVKVFGFPNVDFAVSPTQCTGKEIQFTDISFTPDGTPITNWNWYFSGLATDTLQNPRFIFNTQGNYTIQLTAKNIVGCAATKLRSIAVSAPPVPKFTFSPQNGLPPLNVVYTNQSPVSGNYLWSYGDGSPWVQAYNPPQHIYTTKGTYLIQLVATDFRGCTDTLTKYILVDKAYVDGVMASISITPNGDFYKIQATVINNSNIEITSMGLSLQLGSGSVIRENWTGSLLPGQTTVYLFTGEIKVGENGQIPVVCASIENINNNTPEDRTDNNTTCKEVAVGSFSIMNVYPNPANDNINFGVMLPKDGKVIIRFIDILGHVLHGQEFNGNRGYNQFIMPVNILNSGVYIGEVSYDGETIREKFMVKNK